MATSGSDNYSATRTEVINLAFQLIGVYGIGRTASAEDYTLASSLLNLMLKRWQSYGYHLWAKQEGVLFIAPNTASYLLGNAATDAKATLLSDLVLTQLNGAAATSATSLTVDSTTNMAISDYIGVVLSDKTIHWTTIATIPTSTSLTLTIGLTSAALDNALVYTFTSKLTKPLRIIGMARWRTGVDSGSTSTERDLPLMSMSYDDYQNMPVKTTGSTPNQFHYNPKLNNGTMFLFPRPTDGAGRVHFTYERRIEDMDNGTDEFDLPSEWLEPVAYQLAVRLGPAFGKLEKAAALLPVASDMLENALKFDTEMDEIYFTPGYEC